MPKANKASKESNEIKEKCRTYVRRRCEKNKKKKQILIYYFYNFQTAKRFLELQVGSVWFNN